MLSKSDISIEQHQKEWRSLVQKTERIVGEIQNAAGESLSLDLKASLSELDHYHANLEKNQLDTLRTIQDAESYQNLLVDFFDDAPIGFLILKSGGSVEKANHCAANYWKISKDRFCGLGLYGLIAKDDISIFTKALQIAEATKQKKSINVKCRRLGGDYFWGRFDITLSSTEGTNQGRFICSVFDISADHIIELVRKKTSVGLTATTSMGFFEQLTDFLTGLPNVDHASVAVFSKNNSFTPLSHSSRSHIAKVPDYDRKLDIINQAQTDLNSLLQNRDISSASSFDFIEPHGDVLTAFNAKAGVCLILYGTGHTILGEVGIFFDQELVDRRMYESVLNAIALRCASEFTRFNESKHLRKTSIELEKLVNKRTQSLQKNNEKLGLEVEKRKLTEKKLIKAMHSAEEAALAKSAFLANMSHEIRTPINGIIGASSLLEAASVDESSQEYLRIIHESSKSLLTIINDILDLSKLEASEESFERTRVDLRLLLRNVFEAQRFTIVEKNIDFFVEYPSNQEEIIYTDSIRLRQVVDNLVTNALKFTSKGHVVIKVKAEPNKGMLTIAVEDTGIGMTKEQVKRCFERFSQADSSTTRKYGGTGLGLPICSRIVDIMKGHLLCRSTPGKGTVFSFTVPMTFALGASSSNTPPRPYKGLFGSTSKEELKSVYVCLAFSRARLQSGMLKLLRAQGIKADVIHSESEEKDNTALLSKLKKSSKRIVIATDRKRLSEIEQLRCGLKNHELILLRSTADSPPTSIPANSRFLTSPFSAEELVSAIMDTAKTNRNMRSETLKSESSFSEKHVLVAEDNAVNRLVACDMLKALGAKVTIAENGEQALDQYAKCNFDMILMDCLMPIMDGYEAVRILKNEMNCSIPIVAVTANAMKGDKEKCLSVGFDGFLSKPYRLSDLEKLGPEYFTSSCSIIDDGQEFF